MSLVRCFTPVAFFILLVSGLARGQAKPAIAIDDLMTIRNVVDLALSPAGEMVVYVVSTPDAKGVGIAPTCGSFRPGVVRRSA